MSRKSGFVCFLREIIVLLQTNVILCRQTKNNHDEKNEFVIDGNNAERCCLRW